MDGALYFVWMSTLIVERLERTLTFSEQSKMRNMIGLGHVPYGLVRNAMQLTFSPTAAWNPSSHSPLSTI